MQPEKQKKIIIIYKQITLYSCKLNMYTNPVLQDSKACKQSGGDIRLMITNWDQICEELDALFTCKVIYLIYISVKYTYTVFSCMQEVKQFLSALFFCVSWVHPSFTRLQPVPCVDTMLRLLTLLSHRVQRVLFTTITSDPHREKLQVWDRCYTPLPVTDNLPPCPLLLPPHPLLLPLLELHPYSWLNTES